MYEQIRICSEKFSLYLVHPVDLERIETTFKDLTAGSGELAYTNFKRDVFAQFLPEKLATVGSRRFAKQAFLLFSVSITFVQIPREHTCH